MADLDCHLNWRIKDGSTKTCIKDVIDEVQRRLSKGLLPLPNNLLLCYLYNDDDNKDLVKAKEALKSAEQNNNGDYYDQEACQWIIEANAFCMKEAGDQRTKNELLDRQGKFSAAQRATIKALHAFCLVRFGPNGFPEAAKLYDEANKLTEGNNFLFLFQHAVHLAKIRRCDKMSSTARKKERRLWDKAVQQSIQVSKDPVLSTEFVVRLAEAANDFDKLGAIEICCTLFDVIDIKDSLAYHRALVKIHKVFRICRSEGKHFTEDIKQRMSDLVQRLFSIEMEDINSSQFFHALALELQYQARQLQDENERQEKLLRCESLLKRAVTSDPPGNIYAEFMLIEIQTELKHLSYEDALDCYRSLQCRFRKNEKDVATILLNLGWYQITNAAASNEIPVHEGIKSIDQAAELDKTAVGRLLSLKSERLIRRLTVLKRTGYVTWFEHKYSNKDFAEDAQRFLNSQTSEAQNEAEVQFVTVKLANVYLQNGQCKEAELLENNITNSVEKSFLKLKRLLTLMASVSEFNLHSRDVNLELNSLTEQSPVHGFKICTELVSKFESLSWDKEWKPETREVYEICARVCLAIRAYGNDESKAEIEMKLCGFLQISANAEDNLRKHRFQATLLHLSNLTSDAGVSGRNSLLLQTICKAKTCLDNCVSVLLPHSTSYFPFAFICRTDAMKEAAKWDRDSASQDLGCSTSRSAGPSHNKKLLDNISIGDFIVKSKADRSYFNACFQLALKRIGKVKVKGEAEKGSLSKYSVKNIERTLPGFWERLRDREYEIFTTEGCWLAHWVNLRNQSAHSVPTDEAAGLVKQLEQSLLSDSEFNEQHHLRGGPNDAYGLAHKAAEFAEQSQAWFREASSQLETAPCS